MSDALPAMRRETDRLAAKEFDLIVIGGGMFGACAVWDAVQRGLSVALIERDDFCSGASANCFKMVHGGIRYLQHADVRRLRASCFERSALLRIAPHLVHPLPIVIPTHKGFLQGRTFLATGMAVYDALTLDRNFGISDSSQKIPGFRILGRDRVLQLFPNLPSEALTGAAVFCDGQMYNPTRLVLAFVQSAMHAGAVAANYVEAVRFIEQDGRVTGVAAVDRITGDQIEIRGKVTLNAAGPWSEGVARSPGRPDIIPRGTYSRDLCFVVPRKFQHPYAVAVAGQTKDPDAIVDRQARHLFVVPWREYTLVGVWHVVTDKNPDRVSVEQSELSDFIEEINWAYPALELKLDDVTMVNSGLVPFGQNKPGSIDLSYGKESRIIDHARESNLEGLVTLIGIRYTMGRGDAEKAVNIVARKLGSGATASVTHRKPVWGGNIDSLDDLIAGVRSERPFGLADSELTALVRNYGSHYRHVLSLGEERTDLASPFRGSTVLKAEAVHAVRYEMAHTLADVVFRRTDLGSGGNPGTDVVNDCAAIVAAEQGWSEAKKQKEIATVLQRFPMNSRDEINALAAAGVA